MSAKHAIPIVVVALVFGIAAAGCGSVAPKTASKPAAKPPTRAEWANQANTICDRKSEELSTLKADLFAQMNELGLESFLGKVLAVEEKSLADLRKLPAPPADASAIDELLELQGEANDAYRRAIPELAAERPRAGFRLLASSNELALRSGRIAANLGAEACGETVSLDEFIPENGSGQLLADDFSSRSSSVWQPNHARGTAAAVSSGAYRLSVTGRDQVAGSTALFSETTDRVAVAADMKLLQSSRGPEFAAVGCVAGSGRGGGYNFVVGPDRSYYAIMKVSASGVHVLQEGQRADVVRGVRHVNDVRGECLSAGPGKATILSLSVNGKPVVEVRDRRGLGNFIGTGLIVYSHAGGTTVEFDNVVADAL